MTAIATTAVPVSDRDAILSEIHELKRMVGRLVQPVSVLSHKDAATRVGISPRTLVTLTLRGVFTDGRAPGHRVRGAPRLYYADELDVYRTEGEDGVARLRREQGRGA